MKHESRNTTQNRVRDTWYLYRGFGGGRKEGTTRGQRDPLMSWATRMVQWRVQWVAKSRGGANPIKARPSSDWSLQLDSMK